MRASQRKTLDSSGTSSMPVFSLEREISFSSWTHRNSDAGVRAMITVCRAHTTFTHSHTQHTDLEQPRSGRHGATHPRPSPRAQVHRHPSKKTPNSVQTPSATPPRPGNVVTIKLPTVLVSMYMRGYPVCVEHDGPACWDCAPDPFGVSTLIDACKADGDIMY